MENFQRWEVQEMTPRKIKKIMAATFSGIFSLEDFIPISNLIRHNDMHLRNIPPYLKGLTSTEMALILKISVITNIHVLKTGMYAGLGHSTSLPQPMNIAIQSVQEAYFQYVPNPYYHDVEIMCEVYVTTTERGYAWP